MKPRITRLAPSKSATAPKAREAAPVPRESDSAIFRAAAEGAEPIRAPERIVRTPPRRRPVPIRQDSHREPPEAAAHLELRDDDTATEDEGSFLRSGMRRDTLRKLRRAHWGIDAQLDLHGLTGEQAESEALRFLLDARQRGHRCVLVIHGKGLRNPDREPVLKRRIRKLLSRHPEVLAFTEPRDACGGGGAVLVLLHA